MINIVPLISSWALLAAAVVGLVVYRKMVSSREDDTLHLDQSTASQQNTVAHKLEVIDRWGKILTAVAFLYGLVVAAVYFFNVWNTTPTY
jgi:hypothetical protein